MPPNALAVPNSDDEVEAEVLPGVMPTSAVVKVERDKAGTSGSLVQDLMREYEAVFPLTEHTDEIEVKEVVCDPRLLSCPVVIVEKLTSGLGGDASEVPVTTSSRCNKTVQRVRSRVATTRRVTRSCSNVKPPRSDVSIENIVDGKCCKPVQLSSEVPSTHASDKTKHTPSGSNYKRHAVHVENCTYCDFTCHSVLLFKAHLRDVHKLFVCSLATCTSNWVSKGGCKAHQELHRRATYQCEECGWYHSSKAEFDRHVVKHSVREPWMCKHKGCKRTFKRKGDLTAHSLTHVSAKKKLYSCDQCTYSSTQKRYVTYHKRKHEPPRIKCDLCGSVFRYFEDKKRHLARGCSE